MRAVIQLVKQASVVVDKQTTGAIEKGFLILLGVKHNDSEKEATSLADKIANLRVFPDQDDKMNLSLLDTGGSALVVSQFTLYGDCRKGRRPSYSKAARPDLANRLYEFFIAELVKKEINVATGRFQAMMEVSLINDGPVTLLIDSDKEF
jgi:D-tyrosyl-tRNA(Tyr) deacylase